MNGFFTLLFCLTVGTASAQTDGNTFDFRTAVTLSPTAFIGFDRTLLLGAERRIADRFAIVLDAGVVVSSGYLNTAQQEVFGFTFRPGIKYYTDDRTRTYVILQAFFKKVNYKVYDWLGKNCVNDIPTYDELQEFTYVKNTVSFAALTGSFLRLSDGVFFEYYGGLGVKIKNQGPKENNACYLQGSNGRLGNFYAKHSMTPIIPIGLKLVIQLNKGL